jgi:hypothetical protein
VLEVSSPLAAATTTTSAFTVFVRIPSWVSAAAQSATVTATVVSKNSSTRLAGVPGSYLPVVRAWETEDYIRYSLPYGFSVKLLLAAVGSTWDQKAQSVVLLGLDPMSPDKWMAPGRGRLVASLSSQRSR